jgi:hypothetical protein
MISSWLLWFMKTHVIILVLANNRPNMGGKSTRNRFMIWLIFNKDQLKFYCLACDIITPADHIANFYITKRFEQDSFNLHRKAKAPSLEWMITKTVCIFRNIRVRQTLGASLYMIWLFDHTSHSLSLKARYAWKFDDLGHVFQKPAQ